MSLPAEEVVTIVTAMSWHTLDVGGSGRVTISELGRYLRQQGLAISNFTLLRICSEGQTPGPTVEQESFEETKDRILDELQTKQTIDPQQKKTKNRANYLELWREFSRSRDESGEIPISELENVVFAECNPTKELLDSLKQIKGTDGSESLNFEEFCEILENLPRSGVVDEDTLLRAFQTEDPEGRGYITRAQLHSFLVDNGNEPLSKSEVDEMMDDCGDGENFNYKDWIERVITIKSMSEK